LLGDCSSKIISVRADVVYFVDNFDLVRSGDSDCRFVLPTMGCARILRGIGDVDFGSRVLRRRSGSLSLQPEMLCPRKLGRIGEVITGDGQTDTAERLVCSVGDADAVMGVSRLVL
jgi:hypothetical protein